MLLYKRCPSVPFFGHPFLINVVVFHILVVDVFGNLLAVLIVSRELMLDVLLDGFVGSRARESFFEFF